MRGDRCEGIYAQELGSTILQIASLTYSFDEFDPNTAEDLTVEWKPSRCGGDVHVRSLGTRRRLYYRMDTIRKGSTTSYTWPAAMLAAQGLARDDLGVTAWSHCPAVDRDVYLPVQVHTGPRWRSKANLQLVVIPGVELSEIYVTLALTDDRGQTRTTLIKQRALNYGYYPAERTTVIPIPDVTLSGLYHLELSARLRSGSVATAEIWFHHAKN